MCLHKIKFHEKTLKKRKNIRLRKRIKYQKRIKRRNKRRQKNKPIPQEIDKMDSNLFEQFDLYENKNLDEMENFYKLDIEKEENNENTNCNKGTQAETNNDTEAKKKTENTNNDSVLDIKITKFSQDIRKDNKKNNDEILLSLDNKVRDTNNVPIELKNSDYFPNSENREINNLNETKNTYEKSFTIFMINEQFFETQEKFEEDDEILKQDEIFDINDNQRKNNILPLIGNLILTEENTIINGSDEDIYFDFDSIMMKETKTFTIDKKT